MQLAKLTKIIAGVVAFFGAAFAIIQGFREYRPPVPKLQAALINVEHVSSRTEIPDVKISLAFKDQSVSDLWLCRVRFQNIGGVTLHTTGSRPNTQNPVVISVPDKYEILKIEPKGIDPKDSGFEAQIRQRKDERGGFDRHQFEVIFEQWRKGEAIEAVLYLAGSSEHADRPKLIPKGRPILDGDVVPADLSTTSAPEMKRLSMMERAFGLYWTSIFRLYAIIIVGFNILPLFSVKPFATILSPDWQSEHPVPGLIIRLISFSGLYIAFFAMMP